MLSLYFINVFQMTAWGLLRRTYYFNEQQTKYVSIYLNDDNLKKEIMYGTPSGHAGLNEMQWFILVTFKSDIYSNDMHELGDPQHTLSVFCGRYIDLTNEKTPVHLSKKVWSQLIDFSSACVER